MQHLPNKANARYSREFSQGKFLKAFKRWEVHNIKQPSQDNETWHLASVQCLKFIHSINYKVNIDVSWQGIFWKKTYISQVTLRFLLAFQQVVFRKCSKISQQGGRSQAHRSAYSVSCCWHWRSRYSYLAFENLIHKCIHVACIESMFQRCHFINAATKSPDIRLQK